MSTRPFRHLALFVLPLALAGALRAQTPAPASPQAQAPPLAPAAPAPAPAPAADPNEQPVKLETPTGAVHGTLLMPASTAGKPAPVPVALLIAGSGPTDRNGNTQGIPGTNDSLKLLAQGLAARGIASLRYDKRGIGESAAAAPSEADLRFETYIDDAAAWVRQLDADPRFSIVTVVGHSEGSLIGMIAAQRSPADAYVSIAGLARPASQVLRTQLEGKLPPELKKESDRILAELEAGRTAPENVPQPLAPLYRTSVQPYLISWFRYTPTQEIAKLAVPVLVAQGSTDLQVTADEAKALVAAKPGAELVILEGMNHTLKAAAGDQAQQMKAYTDPSLPVVPELVERLAGFIEGVKRRAGRSSGK